MTSFKLSLFLGKEIKLNENISLYSPTINEIEEIGEIRYNIYLGLAIFNKEILKYLFELNDEEYEQIEDKDSFDIFTSTSSLSEYMCSALSFFTKQDVQFYEPERFFFIDRDKFLDKNNYQQVAKIIRELNGLEKNQEENIKFRNNKAREIYKKLQQKRMRYKKNEEMLELKDMLSILCNAEGNGINIFNVGKLTIYQVYEHFERLNIKEQHQRILKVWANGLLKENDKLPEWLVKTKL